MHFFFYGTLRHLPLLAAVLGRLPEVAPARLPGHRVSAVAGQDFPLLLPDAGAGAEGVLALDLTEADVSRLNFYEGGFAYAPQPAPVLTAGGVMSAMVYFPAPGHWTAQGDWSLDAWAARLGAAAAAAAEDVMALYGRKPAAEVAARRRVMLVRGASRARAATDPVPATLRRASRPGDVAVARRAEPYAKFFAVEEYDLSFRRFDGTMGPEVNRAVFVSGDAVTVLPYDPVRDRVLLVEQFRPGPYARGDRAPWQLEAIAGRVDPGEDPADTARREAVEEAGLALGALLPVASYYPSPGGKSEFLYSYVAIADLPDGSGIVAGMADEAEDIRGHVIPFARLMDLVASGEVANAPLILTALWLQRERERLREM